VGERVSENACVCVRVRKRERQRGRERERERETKRVKRVMEIRICCRRALKRKRGGLLVAVGPKRFGFD